MGRGKSRLTIKAELLLAEGVARLFRFLPHRLAQRFGGAAGIAAHDLIGIRKRLAREQLAAAFPEKSEHWVNRTTREVYRHLGTVAAETARLPVLAGGEFDRWVVFEGREQLAEVLEEGRGCLVASAHLGCWEYAGAWTAAHGLPVTYVVAEQANPQIEELIDNARRSCGIEIVKRKDATRGIISALKRNRLVAMMIDQDARSQGEFIDFFGRRASTFRGVAVFALKMKSPVGLITTYRAEDGRVHIRFKRAEFTPSGDRERDIHNLTEYLTHQIEEDIRRHPEQWLWLHRRWKTNPPSGT